MSAIRLLAGKGAFEQIESNGLVPELFTQLLAASGGPKWIGIAGIDQYLFGEFFKNRQDPLYLLGASSGAWRLACLAQNNPLEAYDRLIEHYIHQRYDKVPTRDEVSQKIQGVVAGILGDEQGRDIVANPIFRSHFVACRARHLNQLTSKTALSVGLSLAASTNFVSRKSLAWHFERVIISHKDKASPFGRLRDLPTKQAKLVEENIEQVLLATGAIPLILAPVSNIPKLPKGKYYDGGITDYHFDLPIPKESGLTLYPHFYPHMTPGWFDKALPWRKASVNYHNALVIAPTNAFIDSLPYSKIPDREDFKRLDSQTRIDYWNTSILASQRLGDELNTIIANGKVMDYLEPLY